MQIAFQPLEGMALWVVTSVAKAVTSELTVTGGLAVIVGLGSIPDQKKKNSCRPVIGLVFTY